MTDQYILDQSPFPFHVDGPNMVGYLTRLDAIMRQCGVAEVDGGWRADMPDRDADPTAFMHWVSSKTMLAVGELSEAVEELRNGHAPHEVYLSEGGKPEGFPVEVADAIIRLLALWHAVCRVGGTGEPLSPANVIGGKLEYNASRGARHGGKAI